MGVSVGGFYYALRYKSAPQEIRIEKAASPVDAFRRAFGRPPTGAEWKRLLKRTYLAPLLRRKALCDPNDWTAFPEPRREAEPPPPRIGETVDLSSGKCPDCAHAAFRPGPRGGAAIKVQCGLCGACFNYCGPLPAQRIECVPGVYSVRTATLAALSMGASFVHDIMSLAAERDRYRRIAREIVAMLIQRKRDARRMVKIACEANVNELALINLRSIEGEARTAAEIARRILYGVPR